MKTKSLFTYAARTVALCACGALAALDVQGGTIFKAGTGTDLTAGGSWVGSTAPGASDTAAWGGASLGAGLTLGSATSWNGIWVTNAASDIDISGAGALTLGSGGIDLSASVVNLSITNDIALNADQAWVVNSGQTLTSAGAISGGSALNISGVSYSYPSYLPTSSTLLFSGVSLASVTSVSGAINGGWITGGPIAAGTYLLTNDGTNATYELEFWDGATYTKACTVQLTQVGPDIYATQTGAYYKADTTGIYLGTDISTNYDGTPPIGSGGYGVVNTVLNLGAVGTGTVVLSGTSTFTGSTIINAGTLTIGGAGQLGGGNYSANITDSAAFNYNSSATQELSGVISGSGTVTQSGSGTLTLSGVNTYTGNTAISAGTLEIGGSGQLGSGTYTAAITNSGTLKYNSSASQTLSGNITGAGTLNQAGAGTLTLAQNSAQKQCDNAISGSGPLAISGGAAIFYGLTGNMSAYTGAATISGLVFTKTSNAGSASAAFTQNSGSLWLVNNNDDNTTVTMTYNMGSLSGTGTIAGNAYQSSRTGTKTLSIGALGTSTTYSGVIQNQNSGGGAVVALTKVGAGTFMLAGANSYTGVTTVSNGTLQVNGTLASGSAVTVNGGTLNGTGTIGGTVMVTNGGTLEAGDASIGTLTINSNVTLTANATNVMRINKTGTTLTSDQITGTGNLAMGGTLVVTATGDALANGDTFTLFAKGSYSGSFETSNLPALTAPLVWDTSSLGVNGTIRVYNPSTVTVPIFSPTAGYYLTPQTVSITSDAGSTIFYTTDGTTPTTSSAHGLSPITGITIPANTTMTLEAFATNSGYSDSPVVTATYNIMPEAVWTSLAGGSWPISLNWSNGLVASGNGITADFALLAMTNNEVVTLDGARTIGNLKFGDVYGAYGWTLNTGGGGPLTLAGPSTPAITVSNGTATINALLTGTNGLVKDGTGTLTLSAQNTYTGGTVVNAGTLTLAMAPNYNNDFVGGSLLVNSNTSVMMNDHMETGFTTHAANVTLEDGSSLTLATGKQDYCGNLTIIGSANLAVTGDNFRVSGNVTATPTDTAAPNIPALALSGGSYGLVGGMPLFTVNDNTNWPVDLTVGAIAEVSASGLVKAGAGTMELNGASSYTGVTVVSNGTLIVSGSIDGGGVTVDTNATLQPMASGTISGPTTVQAGGTLTLDPTAVSTGYINSTLALEGNVVIKVTKDYGFATADNISGMSGVTYGGTLIVTNVTSDTNLLAAGDKFILFTKTAGTYGGSFATLDLPPLSAGLYWDVSGLTADGSITVTTNTPLPTFNPPAGGYVGSPTVTISGVSGSTIYYTTDGSDPKTSGTVMSGATPVTVVVPVNTSLLTITAYASNSLTGASANATANYSTIATPTWLATYGGTWSDGLGNSWSNNVVANGSDVTADFSTLTLGADATVTLDGTWKVGHLLFGDQGGAYSWTLAPGYAGSLTLAASNTPTITVNNQTNLISAPLGGVSGFTKLGAGMLVISNADTGFSGGTVTVNQGSMALDVPGILQDDTGNIFNHLPVQVNSGASLILAQQFNSGATRPYTLDGGTLACTGGNNFLNNLTLKNGAQVTGTGVSVGNVSDGLFTVSGTNASTVSANILIYDNNLTTFTLNVANVTGDANPDLTLSGVIADNYNLVGYRPLIKTGAGTMALTGTNTYAGNTTVSNGTLVVNGALGSGAVYVAPTAVLSGTGTIGGAVTNDGAITPGTATGTLTIGGALALNAGSTSTFDVDGSAATNNSIAAGGTVNYGGTLNVVTSGTFSAGQTFTLFSGAGATSTSSFASVTGSPGGGLNFSFTNGVLSVVSTNVMPVVLTNSISGNTLSLSWPAGQGWRLEYQTNSLGTGLSTNWLPLTDSSVSSTNITVDPAKPTVFYRLVNP